MAYFTHRPPLRSRCVALVTRDPALYAELAPVLRERRVPTVSLLPGQRIPPSAAIVLTSPEEVPRIRHRHVVAVPSAGDRTALWAEVEAALATDDGEELIVGIDPGPRPGYAVVAGHRTLVDGVLEHPEAAGRLGALLRRRFGDRGLRFRVGDGDRLARDRTLNALLPLRRPVELVAEHGTTPTGGRRRRDPAAARAIALTDGVPVHGPAAITTTAGEVQDLQRKSREGSGGRFTIPRHVAERVLRGELTLTEAIDDGRQRYTARSRDRTHAGPRSGEGS